MSVDSLSDDELRAQLQSRGVNVGPIVDTTRNVYRKRLHKLMHSDVGADGDLYPKLPEATDSHESDVDVGEVSFRHISPQEQLDIFNRSDSMDKPVSHVPYLRARPQPMGRWPGAAMDSAKEVTYAQPVLNNADAPANYANVAVKVVSAGLLFALAVVFIYMLVQRAEMQSAFKHKDDDDVL